MRFVLNIARAVVLLLIAAAIAVLWFYCHNFLPWEFASAGPADASGRRTAVLATLVILFLAPALPIYRLYPRHAARAAAAVGWVPLALAVVYARTGGVQTGTQADTGAAIVEGLACWAAIVVGAWSASALARNAA